MKPVTSPAAALIPVILLAITTTSSQAGLISWNGGSTDDFIDWSTLGPEGTVLSNPFSAVSTHGLSVDVSMPSGDFERVDEGSGWLGNFTPGAALLWTSMNDGPITFRFASPINGFGGGAKVQPDSIGAFSVSISAFDDVNNLLGLVTRSGSSTMDEDGSAVFAGILSDVANIRSIRIDVSTSGNPITLPGFALDSLQFRMNPVFSSIPDDGWTGLMAMVGCGLVIQFQRRHGSPR